MRRQTALVFFFDMLAKLMSGAATVLVIRLLPPAEYASYTVVLAIMWFVVSAIGSGVNRIYILNFNRLGGNESRGPLLGTQMFFGLVVTAPLCVISGINLGLGLALAVLLLSYLVSDFLRTDYQRRLAFQPFMYVELTRCGLFLGLIILVSTGISKEHGAIIVTGLQALAVAIVTIPLLLRSRLLLGFSHVGRGLAMIKSLIEHGNGFLFGYFFALSLFAQLSVFLLKGLSENQSLAAYGSAFRYYSFLMLTLNAVHAVVLPTIARAKTKVEVEELNAKCRWLLWPFLFGVLALAVLSPWLIPLADGGRYPESIAAFQVLALSAGLSFAFSPYGNFLMRLSRHRFLFNLACITGVMNLLLAFWLIPIYGALGAAVATLISCGVLNIAVYMLSRRLLNSIGELLPAC